MNSAPPKNYSGKKFVLIFLLFLIAFSILGLMGTYWFGSWFNRRSLPGKTASVLQHSPKVARAGFRIPTLRRGSSSGVGSKRSLEEPTPTESGKDTCPCKKRETYPLTDYGHAEVARATCPCKKREFHSRTPKDAL